jgi:hypothetical protein
VVNKMGPWPQSVTAGIFSHSNTMFVLNVLTTFILFYFSGSKKVGNLLD